MIYTMGVDSECQNKQNIELIYRILHSYSMCVYHNKQQARILYYNSRLCYEGYKSELFMFGG